MGRRRGEQVLTLSASGSQLPVVEGQVDPPIRFARTVDGVSIGWCRHGSGPVLLFVRGWISDIAANWRSPAYRSFFTSLASSLEVVRFDARGNGSSDRDPSELSLEGLVADVEAVVAAAHLDRLVLFGSAYGGPVAASFAARNPQLVEAVVLHGTYARGADLADEAGRDRILELVGRLHRRPEAAAALSYLTSPDHEGSHRARIDAARRSITADAAQRLYALSFALDVTEELRTITAPALVLHPEGCTAIPVHHGRRVAGLVPDSRFIGLSGSGTNPWDEHASETLHHVGELLGLRSLGPSAVRSAPFLAVLFTDLVGSTAMTSRLGDELAQALVRQHDSIVRAALGEHGGTLVKHTGDGAMASFPSVSAALRAALDVQRAAASVTVGQVLQLRIGINAGEPVADGRDLFGTVVQMAARLCDAAQPGEVLVSNVVRELAAGKGFTLVPAGDRDLKGFTDPVRAWRLEVIPGQPVPGLR